MPLAGAGLRSCAKLGKASWQEMAPMKMILFRANPIENILCIKERWTALLAGSFESDMALFDADVGFSVINENGVERTPCGGGALGGLHLKIGDFRR